MTTLEGDNIPSHVDPYIFNEECAVKSLCDFYLRNPDSFIAGELHNQFCHWEFFLLDNDTFSLVKKWIKDGVDVTEFFFLHILKVILKVVVTTLYFLHKDFFKMHRSVNSLKNLFAQSCMKEYLLNPFLLLVKLENVSFHL